jgi:hypothetical protein
MTSSLGSLRSGLMVSALLAFSTFATAADDPAKKAVKKVTNATDAALETLDETLKLLQKQLDLDLDLIDLDVKNGGGQLSDAALVFEGLKSFQNGVASAIEVTSQALHSALSAADVLNDPALQADNLPKGLAFGDGGLCDDYREAVLKAVDKSIAAAEKRLRKTTASFEKHADVAFLVRLQRPREFLERTGPINTTFGVYSHSIAILMSASRTDVAGENRLFAFGICHNTDELRLTRVSSSGTSSSGPPVLDGNTWSRMYVDVDPGYYVFRITHDFTTGGGAFGSINVR